jgi:hypothetical protein
MAQMLAVANLFGNASVPMSIECENLVNDLSTINPSDDFFYFLLKILNLFNSQIYSSKISFSHIFSYLITTHINDIFFTKLSTTKLLNMAVKIALSHKTTYTLTDLLPYIRMF